MCLQIIILHLKVMMCALITVILFQFARSQKTFVRPSWISHFCSSAIKCFPIQFIMLYCNQHWEHFIKSACAKKWCWRMTNALSWFPTFWKRKYFKMERAGCRRLLKKHKYFTDFSCGLRLRSAKSFTQSEHNSRILSIYLHQEHILMGQQLITYCGQRHTNQNQINSTDKYFNL